MSKHRIEIDLSSAGWFGWLAFALLAIAALILSFFFFAVIIVVLVLMVLVALVRVYSWKHKVSARKQEDMTPPGRLPPPRL